MDSPTALSKTAAALFVALIFNSAYLWGWSDPTLGYFVQVALHPLVGLALAASAAWLLAARRWQPAPLTRAGLATSAAGLGLGAAILVVGATLGHRVLVDAHR